MAIIHLTPDQIAHHIRAKLAIVMPIYNEQENVSNVIQEWTTCLNSLEIDYQIILLNDGSRDNTLEHLLDIESSKKDSIVVVNKPNSGHGRTCRLGYDATVAAPSVEWVLQIDSDGQCDPSYFLEFWSARNDADCIFGIRKKREDGWARALTSKICKWSSSILCGFNLVDPNVPYRLMRKSTLANALKRIPTSFDIHNVALTFIFKRIPQIRWRYIPIRFKDRRGGNNSINLFKVVHWGINMLIELRHLRK